jgi:uncharacterized protein (DUF302 family)
MMKAIAVTHVTESRKCDFDAFIERFQSQLGTHDISAYRNRLGDTNAPGEVEAILKSQEGSSGLMLFSSYDHGALLSIKTGPQRGRQYVIGNPLFASRMTEHDIRAGLYAPLRVFVYVDQDGQVAVDYDLPSSLFGQFGDERIREVARELDQKLSTLISNAYGR